MNSFISGALSGMITVIFFVCIFGIPAQFDRIETNIISAIKDKGCSQPNEVLDPILDKISAKQ